VGQLIDKTAKKEMVEIHTSFFANKAEEEEKKTRGQGVTDAQIAEVKRFIAQGPRITDEGW
jgi:hypothetical protein